MSCARHEPQTRTFHWSRGWSAARSRPARTHTTRWTSGDLDNPASASIVQPGDMRTLATRSSRSGATHLIDRVCGVATRAALRKVGVSNPPARTQHAHTPGGASPSMYEGPSSRAAVHRVGRCARKVFSFVVGDSDSNSSELHLRVCVGGVRLWYASRRLSRLRDDWGGCWLSVLRAN